MQLTIFAKKRTATDDEGKAKIFYNYLTTLKKKDGTELKCAVKFKEECGQPKADKCPMNIVVNKEDCNLATKTYVKEETGEALTAYTLWVSAYSAGEQYVDHSLDEIDC